jgi:NAD(P)-dependent dehydrogenase (short-subunit alcohol dehydrogenase family)
MMDINFTGVFMTATAVARRMLEYRCSGSIVLVASMSGFVANKSLLSSVYNSSKAALVQLARNLAMEWGKYGIRVNSLCPGHIVTPMVRENFREDPELEGKWKVRNPYLMTARARPRGASSPSFLPQDN